jgi:hypothetical protein
MVHQPRLILGLLCVSSVREIYSLPLEVPTRMFGLGTDRERDRCRYGSGGKAERVVDGLRSPLLQVDMSHIIMHEADEPNRRLVSDGTPNRLRPAPWTTCQRCETLI